MSSFFTLDRTDFLKGVAVAFITPIVVTFGAALQAPGFDFMTFDWKHLLALGVAAGLSYLVKNLFSTADGKVFGFIG